MHGVAVTAAELAKQASVNFIRRYGATWNPQGHQAVPIEAAI